MNERNGEIADTKGKRKRRKKKNKNNKILNVKHIDRRTHTYINRQLD